MAKMTQGFILKAMAAGAVIMVEYVNQPASSACRYYRLSSSNRSIREQTVKKLLEDNLIRPNADGLFGNEGPVQSYSLFRASEGGA